MNDDPLSDIVSSQYARWMYPEPILDVPGWLESNWQWFDPSHAHRLFWPAGKYRPDIDILIAGCGTNQAAIIAYNNPKAKVVAVDVSQPSLDHHSSLKNRYALDNLELLLLAIEEVHSLGLDFDLIISTGVLHHLADPGKGIMTLAQCLRQNGVMALMLYAQFGRIGVEMLQSVFREIGLSQNDASIMLVRDGLACLPSDHPINSYMPLAPDLQYDAGLVDTFLHGRDRSYDVNACLDLVRSAGLVFQDFFLKAPYYPPMRANRSFYSAVASLPREQQWSIMERVNFRNACHFFLANRADRPSESYTIDFSSPSVLDYVPEFRLRCGLKGNRIFRPDWEAIIAPGDAVLIEQMDGQRSIAALVAAAGEKHGLSTQNQADRETQACEFFQSLWQLDFVAFRLPDPIKPGISPNSN